MSTKLEALVIDIKETATAAKDLGLDEYASTLNSQLGWISKLSEEEAEKTLAEWLTSKNKPLSQTIFNREDSKPKDTPQISCYCYKLRGHVGKYLIVGAETNEQSRNVLEAIVDILDGIRINRMVNYEYFYTREINNVPMRPVNEYRGHAPVKAISVDLRRYKQNNQIIIKLYEHNGITEYVQFDAGYIAIEEVVKGFRTAIKRLSK